MTIEELLERKSSGSGLENRQYGRRRPLRWPRGNLYPQKLALTSPTSGGRTAGIVRSRTQATELVLFCSSGILTSNNSGRTESSMLEHIVKISFLIDWTPYTVHILLDLDMMGRQIEFNTGPLFICPYCWEETAEQFICKPEKEMRADGV
jgi:hypothetical protein